MYPVEDAPTVNMTCAPNKSLEADIVEHSVLVRLRGEVDPVGVKELQLHLKYLTSLRPVRVVLDFSDLTLVAPLALKALVGFRQAIVQAGGDVQVVGLQGRVKEAFTTTGMATFFAIKETCEDTKWD